MLKKIALSSVLLLATTTVMASACTASVVSPQSASASMRSQTASNSFTGHLKENQDVIWEIGSATDQNLESLTLNIDYTSNPKFNWQASVYDATTHEEVSEVETPHPSSSKLEFDLKGVSKGDKLEIHLHGIYGGESFLKLSIAPIISNSFTGYLKENQDVIWEIGSATDQNLESLTLNIDYTSNPKFNWQASVYDATTHEEVSEVETPHPSSSKLEFDLKGVSKGDKLEIHLHGIYGGESLLKLSIIPN